MRRLFACVMVFGALMLMGAGCFGGGDTASQEEITLKYWRVFDEDDDFEEIVEAYQALHPNITIEYRKFRLEEYEDELVRALATGEGPDILTVHNTKLREYQDLLTPMPSSITMSYQVQQGGIGKEAILETRTEPTMSLTSLQRSYVDVVADDVVLEYQPNPEESDTEPRIYGLPLALDSLGLFYNKDLLNAAGIAEPPATWDVFQKNVIALTNIDTSTGSITQSGAALGTSENVERAVDILSVLMLQNGTVMTDDRGRVAFAAIPAGTPEGVYPGLDAVRFYTDFANPLKEVYAWSEDLPSSFKAFARGQAAFFFGYAYHVPLLKASSPKLNYGTSYLPQISGGREVNSANYWVEAVAKRSAHPQEAWSFLLFAASADRVTPYLANTQKPTALRALIASQLEDEFVGVFAGQLLTAQSWYRGKDAQAAEGALRELIEAILDGATDPEDALERAANIVSQTY